MPQYGRCQHLMATLEHYFAQRRLAPSEPEEQLQQQGSLSL
ncbi:hypothetical protein HCH_05948 [Hahella chejuensis KCTC 2396]|uniref:Uncharacterized protein n=1 Tax=Hahella chejuensis (strain KCTC 2396) TaxID=349521 RepID=Q2S9S5_HAHCH|nr:hypothetical protein HCH_05948 [Hahella chejuensis KCTC 2396]